MPSDPRDYKLDLSTGPQSSEPPKPATGRPFLSVHFKCCGVYQRVYRNAAGTAYEGNCPKCRKPVLFSVGHGGTSARAFVVE